MADKKQQELRHGDQRPKDKFLWPLLIFTALIFIIHFLTFWIYLGLGVVQSGKPTKTNCFNSMWWSFLTMVSSLFLMQEIWYRCNKATGPTRAIPTIEWLIRLFVSFFFFKGSFIAFVGHASIEIEDAAAWSFFAFFCNAMVFVIYVLRRGVDDPNKLYEPYRCDGKMIGFSACQFILVSFFAIMYGFATYQSVNVSLDYTVEIVYPGQLHNGLHIYCQGSVADSKGTIVIIPDENTPSLAWLDTINVISRENRVCVWDRAGYGWSESGELPRTPNRMADELYETLINAKESIPYFLAPHGKGADIAWAFGRSYFKTLGGMLLINAKSPGWVSEDCPMPKQPLNYDFARTFDNFALTRLNSERSLPNVWKKQNSTFTHKVIAQRSSSRMSNAVYYERITDESCGQNYENYKYGFGDIPIHVFTSGFNINVTCTNELTQQDVECEQYMDHSRRDSPYAALQAYRQTRMSTNSQWYLCSDCSRDVHLDSPHELRIAAIDMIKSFLKLEEASKKSVPDLFQRRESAIMDPQLENNQLVTLVCRTERMDDHWDCYSSLCDWCEDPQACLLTGNRECLSLNMKLFPQIDCANYCRDRDSCSISQCHNYFLPIRKGNCPSGFTCIQ